MLYWQLRYADGRVEDEPEGNASILYSHPGAIALVVTHLVDGERKPVIKIDIPGAPWKPIFYRRHSVGVAGPSSLDLVCFGLAREGENEIESKIWAINRFGKVFDCPSSHFDPYSVQMLVMEKA